MAWELRVERPAIRNLDRILGRDRAQVEAALGRLVADPGSVDLKKLGGRGNEYRMRVGNWRVILDLDNAEGVIRVLAVRRRTSTTY